MLATSRKKMRLRNHWYYYCKSCTLVCVYCISMSKFPELPRLRLLVARSRAVHILHFSSQRRQAASRCRSVPKASAGRAILSIREPLHRFPPFANPTIISFQGPVVSRHVLSPTDTCLAAHPPSFTINADPIRNRPSCGPSGDINSNRTSYSSPRASAL